jgi:hypothetical protein
MPDAKKEIKKETKLENAWVFGNRIKITVNDNGVLLQYELTLQELINIGRRKV